MGMLVKIMAIVGGQHALYICRAGNTAIVKDVSGNGTKRLISVFVYQQGVRIAVINNSQPWLACLRVN